MVIRDGERLGFPAGHEAPTLGNMQVHDVRRDNPQEPPGLRRRFDNHLPVDGFVEEQLHIVVNLPPIFLPAVPMNGSKRRFVLAFVRPIRVSGTRVDRQA